MFPEDEDYIIAAMLETAANQVSLPIVIEALLFSDTAQELDANVQAAVHAAEWLTALELAH